MTQSSVNFSQDLLLVRWLWWLDWSSACLVGLPPLSSFAAVIFRMLWHSGTGLTMLSLKLAIKTTAVLFLLFDVMTHKQQQQPFYDPFPGQPGWAGREMMKHLNTLSALSLFQDTLGGLEQGTTRNINLHPKLTKIHWTVFWTSRHKWAAVSLPNDFLRPRSSRLPITLENAEPVLGGCDGVANALPPPNWEDCCGPVKPTAITSNNLIFYSDNLTI